MKRFQEAVIAMDIHLLKYVFMPMAHWIDWRFHINQYEQAKVWMKAGLAACVVANGLGLQSGSYLIAGFGLLASAFMIYMYKFWLDRLDAASRAYEARPHEISRAAAFFLILIFPPMRLVMIWMGLLFAGSSIAHAIRVPTAHIISHAIADPWMLLLGVSLYVAGGLPPTHTRREAPSYAPPSLARQSS